MSSRPGCSSQLPSIRELFPEYVCNSAAAREDSTRSTFPSASSPAPSRIGGTDTTPAPPLPLPKPAFDTASGIRHEGVRPDLKNANQRPGSHDADSPQPPYAHPPLRETCHKSRSSDPGPSLQLRMIDSWPRNDGDRSDGFLSSEAASPTSYSDDEYTRGSPFVECEYRSSAITARLSGRSPFSLEREERYRLSIDGRASPPPRHNMYGAHASIPAQQHRPEGGHENWDEAKRHTCSICHKKFNRPSSLRIHETTHTGAKPFKCDWPQCGRLFNVNSNMRRHYRNHIAVANGLPPARSRSSKSNHQLRRDAGPGRAPYTVQEEYEDLLPPGRLRASSSYSSFRTYRAPWEQASFHRSLTP